MSFLYSPFNGIAISDIASKIRRIKGNCSDLNLEIIEVNREGINTCLKQEIKKLYFTSKFVKKQFKKYFPNLKIKSTVLLSPSPTANLYIAGLEEYKHLKEMKRIVSTYEYRLLKYNEAFKDCLSWI